MRALRGLALALALLMLLAPVVSRKHRYGHSQRTQNQQPNRRAVTSRMMAESDVESRLQMMDEERELARRMSELHDEQEDSLEAIEDHLIEATSRNGDDDWPPKWAPGAVLVGTLWYSSMFF